MRTPICFITMPRVSVIPTGHLQCVGLYNLGVIMTVMSVAYKATRLIQNFFLSFFLHNLWGVANIQECCVVWNLLYINVNKEDIYTHTREARRTENTHNKIPRLNNFGKLLWPSKLCSIYRAEDLNDHHQMKKWRIIKHWVFKVLPHCVRDFKDKKMLHGEYEGERARRENGA